LRSTRSFSGRRSTDVAAECLTDSSFSDDDDDGDDDDDDVGVADPISRPPTTFQERVASAKLAASSKRSTPAATRLVRTTSQRQDSLATLDPDNLANLLGMKTKLYSLVPAGLDTRTSSDDYSDHGDNKLTTPTRRRVKIRRRTQKTTLPTSSDDEDRSTIDTEKSKRKLNFDKSGRPVSAAGDDDGKKKRASSKTNDIPRKPRENEEKLGRRRTKKDDATAQQSAITKAGRQRAMADPGTLPVFNLGEYQTASTAAMSPRLDAIKKSIERAHKIKQKSQKQPGDRDGRRGRGDDEIGTRKALQTGALLKGKTQFVKLKVHVVDALMVVL